MEKKRGGGGQPEAFDPNTGKYVADGQPNKYYDNPEEKEINNFTKAPNGKSLTELFGDIFGEENEEINSMFGYTGEEKAETFEDKYSKPILEMSQEELLKEIGEHKEYLVQKGIDLSGFRDAFNNDLQLKCANFRQMYKIMEKYPVELKGCKFVNSHRYSDKSANQAYMMSRVDFIRGYIPNIKMNFNAKYFMNYKRTVEMEKWQKGWHPEVDEEHFAVTAFTHEYGHAIFNNIFASRFTLDDYDKIYGEEMKKNGLFSSSTVKDTFERVKDKIADTFKQIKEEIFEIFSEQNNEIIEKRSFFEKETSNYGKKNYAEWLAETFLSLEGGKPTKSALAMGEWLKRNGFMKGEQ